MTATLPVATSTVATTSPATSTASTRHARPVLRVGLAAAAAAAVATTVVAALGQATGASLETGPGEQLPLLGFAQVTFVLSMVGVLIARVVGQRSHRPQGTFVAITALLTAASLIPDAVLHTDGATIATLVATHLVAAAIIIPALAARLPRHAGR